MVQSVLATEPKHPQGHVANGGRGDLSVDQVALHQRILEQGYHRVDVIFAHLANVFEEKRHGLKKKNIQTKLSIQQYRNWKKKTNQPVFDAKANSGFPRSFEHKFSDFFQT